MLDENELSSETRKQVRALKRRIDASIRGYIEEGVADKSIAPCDPKLASFAMSGAINWIGTWYKPSGPLSGLEIASHFAYLLTEGLRARFIHSTSVATQQHPKQQKHRVDFLTLRSVYFSSEGEPIAFLPAGWHALSIGRF